MTIRITYLLAAAVILGPLAVQIYLPALPEMQGEFGVSRQLLQLTFSLYILATGLSQLFTGTLSDRFGRRPLMLAGVVVFTVGSLICAQAANLEQLIAGRIIQAAGGGTSLVVARAVLSDLYPPDEMARRLAVVILIMLIGPTLGPLTGGYLTNFAGWRSIFWLLTIASSAVLALLIYRLPETLAADQRGPSKSMRAGMRLALSRPRFLLYGMIGTTTAAGFLLFISIIPYLMTDYFGESPERFGQWFVVIAIGYGIGNFAAVRFGPTMGIARTVQLGAVGVCAGIGTLIVLELSIGLTSASLFSLMAIVGMAQGFFSPSAQSGAIANVPERAGAASSLLSFSMQAISAALVQTLAASSTNSLWPLLIALAVVHGLGAIGAIYARLTTRPDAI